MCNEMSCEVLFRVYLVVFVFKQKTAYEMRISDWSSDVCSSDLLHLLGVFPDKFTVDVNQLVFKGLRVVGIHGRRMFQDWQLMQGLQIGRASCRERVCQYV